MQYIVGNNSCFSKHSPLTCKHGIQYRKIHLHFAFCHVSKSKYSVSNLFVYGFTLASFHIVGLGTCCLDNAIKDRLTEVISCRNIRVQE